MFLCAGGGLKFVCVLDGVEICLHVTNQIFMTPGILNDPSLAHVIVCLTLVSVYKVY